MGTETKQLTVSEATPQALLQQAIEKGLDVNSLEKLMDLQDRWEANQARKLFFEAFTNFQAKCPEIRKTKKVYFSDSDRANNKAAYNFAPISDIVRQIGESLKDNDLSYRWEIYDDKDVLKVTCLVSHVGGHTERTTMQASADQSGGKNSIQARGSSIEYLKRYTLIGALGISTADEDIDGRLPEHDLDKLHKEFMEVYNKVIQIDSSLTKYSPDNWRKERTGPTYIKAIGEIRRVLLNLTPKP